MNEEISKGKEAPYEVEVTNLMRAVNNYMNANLEIPTGGQKRMENIHAYVKNEIKKQPEIWQDWRVRALADFLKLLEEPKYQSSVMLERK